MENLTNAEFTELAYNNHRDALLYLHAQSVKAEQEREALRESLSNLAERLDHVQTEADGNKNEIDAIRATVLELATEINAPA